MTRRTGKPSYLVEQTKRKQQRTVALAVAALAAGLLIGGAGGYGIGRPSSTDAAVAEIRAAEATRDRQQIAELTDMARATRTRINPVLSDLQTAIAAGKPVPAGTVSGWRQATAEAAKQYADPPSGTTATNVARGGLRAAVDSAATAVDIYARAAALPAAQRAPMLELARRQAVNAATTWSVAATQLDQINIDAGYGHQHVYLDAPDGSGAFTADQVPEGGD
jgi:hypothetical protein